MKIIGLVAAALTAFSSPVMAKVQGPSIFNCQQFEPLRRDVWNSCMQGLKDSSAVTSDERDDVCDDVSISVAHDFARNYLGMQPCE